MPGDIPLSLDEREVVRVIYRWEYEPYAGADSPPGKRDQLRPVSPVPDYLIKAVLYGRNIALRPILALLMKLEPALVCRSDKSIDVGGAWRLDDGRILKTRVPSLWTGHPDGQGRPVSWELKHADGRGIVKTVEVIGPAELVREGDELVQRPVKRMTPCYTLTEAGILAARAETSGKADRGTDTNTADAPGAPRTGETGILDALQRADLWSHVIEALRGLVELRRGFSIARLRSPLAQLKRDAERLRESHDSEDVKTYHKGILVIEGLAARGKYEKAAEIAGRMPEELACKLPPPGDGGPLCEVQGSADGKRFPVGKTSEELAAVFLEWLSRARSGEPVPAWLRVSETGEIWEPDLYKRAREDPADRRTLKDALAYLSGAGFVVRMMAFHGEWLRITPQGEAHLVASAQGDAATTSGNSRASGTLPDEPNKSGYVETPADPSAYVSASEIAAKHTPADWPITVKRLGNIVENYFTNRVRWTRPRDKQGKPIKNRRSVHLGDWAAYASKQTGTDSDGFPRLSESEVKTRTAAVRQTKQRRN